MVQVLPEVRSFGSKLAEALGNVGTGLIEGHQKRQIEKKDAALLDQLGQAKSPVEQVAIYSRLSPEKLKTLSPALSALTKASGKQQEQEQTTKLLQENFPQYYGGGEQEAPQASPQQQAQSPLMGALAALSGASPDQFQSQTPAQQAIGQKPIPTTQDIARANMIDKSGKLGQVLTQERQTGIQEKRAQQKLEQTEQHFQKNLEEKQQKRKLDIHRESEKVSDKIAEGQSRGQHILGAVKDVREALKTHKTGLTWENFFKKKFKGSFLENVGLTPEGAIIESTVPTFLEGGRELFGQRLSDADLSVVLGKTVDLGKSPEANESVLKFAEKSAKLQMEKAKIAREITKEYGGYRPIDFADQVEDRFQQKYGEQIDNAFRESFGPKTVHLLDEQGGDLWVPENEVDQVIEQFKARRA
jgi:hypothetical protein